MPKIIRKNYFSIGGLLTSTTNSISNMLSNQSVPNTGVHIVGYIVVGTAVYYGTKKVNNIVAARWTEFARPKWDVSVKVQYIQSNPMSDIKYKLDENSQIWNITLEGSCNKVVKDQVILPDGHIIVRSETCNFFWGSIVRAITKDYTYGYEYKIDNNNSLHPTPILEISRNGSINVELFAHYPEANPDNWLTETNWVGSLNKVFPSPSEDIYKLELTLIAKKGSSEYATVQKDIATLINLTPKEQAAHFAGWDISSKINLLRTLDQFKYTASRDVIFGYGSRLKFETTRDILKNNIEHSPVGGILQLPMMMPEAKDDRFQTESSNNF